jgi:hypothetical protein
MSNINKINGLLITAESASYAVTASYAPYSTGNLAAVQARRTSGFTLPSPAAIIALDITDVENQATIIQHDNTNTERIYVYSTGLYLIHYHADVGPGTVSDFEFAVIRNSAGNIISGSVVAGKNSSTDKVIASTDTLVLLNANDYVALIGRYIATSSGIANNIVLSVTKLEGVAGPQGPTGATGAPGGVTSIIAGTNISISPAEGTGTVTINSTATGGNVDLGQVIAMTQIMYPFTGF